jgi:pyrroline-5-carboxylate reductase
MALMTTSSLSDALAATDGPIVLAGAGKMGGALLTGWLAQGCDPARLVVLEPSPAPEIAATAARGVRLNPAPDTVGAAAALVIAVKPQVFREVAPALRPYAGPATLVLSVMAGITMATIASACGGHIVRTIPNTPAAIGRGITAAVPAADVAPAGRTLADALLRSTGAVEWIDDEALIDAITAVSGSGPAYVFLLAEAMAQAGRAAGLPEQLASRLARATVAGAGELLHRSDLEAATLRQNVTSPGGTTAAALAVLMADDGVAALMTRAVAAATKRSRELAG